MTRLIVSRTRPVTIPAATTETPCCPNHPDEDLFDISFGIGPAEYICRRCPYSTYKLDPHTGALVECCPGCGEPVDRCDCGSEDFNGD